MKKIIFPIFISSSLLVSCVSSKKFNKSVADFEVLKKEYQDLVAVKGEKEKIDASLKLTNVKVDKLKEELADAKLHNEALVQNNNELNAKLDQIIADNKNVLNSSIGEKQELSELLAAQKAENQKKERQLKAIEAQLKTKEGKMDELQGNLNEREKKVQDLQALLDAQSKSLKELKTRINGALKGFSTSDLSVREENGKVYVSLSQNLLFATGSDKIDPKGQNALKQLATVLAANPDLDILVEGHTDTDGSADLNWDLSSNRSLAVTKLLTANKVNGERITSAGRGMYVPVADNKDATGKAKNRRTDIILSPKLDELYKIIKN